MRVTIRLFAGARELAGAAAVVRDLPDGATVHDLSVALYDAYPGLREMRLRYAVNETYAGPETALADGDKVACIPPVGGG